VSPIFLLLGKLNSITVKKYELLRLASFNTAGLQQSKKNVRVGWSESARAISMDDDNLPIAEFSNPGDSDLDW